jgi:hypothetical protein
MTDSTNSPDSTALDSTDIDQDDPDDIEDLLDYSLRKASDFLADRCGADADKRPAGMFVGVAANDEIRTVLAVDDDREGDVLTEATLKLLAGHLTRLEAMTGVDARRLAAIAADLAGNTEDDRE